MEEFFRTIFFCINTLITILKMILLINQKKKNVKLTLHKDVVVVVVDDEVEYKEDNGRSRSIFINDDVNDQADDDKVGESESAERVADEENNR